MNQTESPALPTAAPLARVFHLKDLPGRVGKSMEVLEMEWLWKLHQA